MIKRYNLLFTNGFIKQHNKKYPQTIELLFASRQKWRSVS